MLIRGTPEAGDRRPRAQSQHSVTRMHLKTLTLNLQGLPG